MKTPTKQKPIAHREDTIPSHDKKAPRADHSGSQVFKDDSTRFREDFLRRYKVPFRFSGKLRSRLDVRP
jgi:hypothetical protein